MIISLSLIMHEGRVGSSTRHRGEAIFSFAAGAGTDRSRRHSHQREKVRIVVPVLRVSLRIGAI